ncbi:hypothetical protein JFN87_30300, partial [Streptomyces bomunensis]|nr:hypothetical protein [Streptomyces montanisoli]
ARPAAGPGDPGQGVQGTQGFAAPGQGTQGYGAPAYGTPGGAPDHGAQEAWPGHREDPPSWSPPGYQPGYEPGHGQEEDGR